MAADHRPQLALGLDLKVVADFGGRARLKDFPPTHHPTLLGTYTGQTVPAFCARARPLHTYRLIYIPRSHTKPNDEKH